MANEKNVIRLDHGANADLKEIIGRRSTGDILTATVRFRIRDMSETSLEGVIQEIELEVADEEKSEPVSPTGEEPIMMSLTAPATAYAETEPA